ncbi:ankyrin repeat-containing domain protein [Echria macrotheca]|uniref:Ankyrin repeat-containing domain protein n=1 Tax=Echria macrotheca TaxID=438768 RepID=A0AAJ0BEE7_9PEZI|nr:ankyrin repeat-containing domain protein [Echria macrotheca]
MALNDESASLDWDAHETEIRNLFISQNKTWKEVSMEMSQRYHFTATERQYKYRYPGLKNVKEHEWAYIEQEMRSREALGKQSLPCLHGQPLPPGRVSRGIARARCGVAKQRSVRDAPGRVQKGIITVRTPSPFALRAATFRPPSAGHQTPEQAAHSVDACGGLEMDPSIFSHSPLAMTSDIVWERESGDVAAIEASNSIFTWRTPSPMQLESHDPYLFWDRAWSPSQVLASPVSSNLANTNAAISLHQVLTANLPWFQVLDGIEKYPAFHGWRQESPGRSGIHPGPATSNALVERREVLSALLGTSDPAFTARSIAEIALGFHGFIPEQRDGDLCASLERILDISSPVTRSLPVLFALAAFFASNNGLAPATMDRFLRWIVKHQYLGLFQIFMEMHTPTIHAFSKIVFESAIRIKNIPILDTLLDRGVDFRSVAYDIASVGDDAFTRRVLANMDPEYFKKDVAGELLNRFLSAKNFDMVRFLLGHGVPVDARNTDGRTALFEATKGDDIVAVRLLLESGADILKRCRYNLYEADMEFSSPLAFAVFKKKLVFVTFMLSYYPDLKLDGTIEGEPMIQWASIHCREILGILVKHMAPTSPGVLLGDLLDSADSGVHALTTYVQTHPDGVSQLHLEQALEESIKGDHFASAMTLLQYGVDPDCPLLSEPPIMTALLERKKPVYVDLLLKHNASVAEPGLLVRAVFNGGTDILKKLLRHQPDSRERMEALVAATRLDDKTIAHADVLLRCGVNIDTPGLQLNPLQTAAAEHCTKMASFLIHRGANVNAVAYPDGGRTALQAALTSTTPIEIARMLLRHGADVSAPPAMTGGYTALEAFCHIGSQYVYSGGEDFFMELLDAGAEINQPGMKPSSVLHGVIDLGWKAALARCLEPHYNTIVDYMWFDNESWRCMNENYALCLTPTQLAASIEDVEALKMLLDYGTDVNELPSERFGRTALQAACELGIGPKKMELVNFLLDRGADVNAEAGSSHGVTALQAAAIMGDLKLVELLISKGADVNAMASFEEGRFAIEGAAEHGRLDTVKMLLNAGAKGNWHLDTGFDYAIELARKNGHFAIANLLETEGPDYLAMGKERQTGLGFDSLGAF